MILGVILDYLHLTIALHNVGTHGSCIAIADVLDGDTRSTQVDTTLIHHYQIDHFFDVKTSFFLLKC